MTKCRTMTLPSASALLFVKWLYEVETFQNALWFTSCLSRLRDVIIHWLLKAILNLLIFYSDNCHKNVELSLSFYHFTTLKLIDESCTALWQWVGRKLYILQQLWNLVLPALRTSAAPRPVFPCEAAKRKKITDTHWVINCQHDCMFIQALCYPHTHTYNHSHSFLVHSHVQ